MMNKLCRYILVSSFLAGSALMTWSQASSGTSGGKDVLIKGQRRYDLIVNQANDTLTFNRGLRAARGNSAGLSDNRGILGDLVGGYMSLGTSTLMSASQTLLNAGLNYLVEVTRDKKPDWQKATLGECKFTKHLPMMTEVLDFYAAPSHLGAMDPTDMLFSGFGCQQYVKVLEPDNSTHDEEVFYVSCSVKNDPNGINRMLKHSKFEIVVDELRFNPYLCNIPNDSLSVDPSTIINFDFDKRKDLEFKIVATIKSSWMNEAIQVAKDVELGKFVITAKIDPKHMDGPVFTYKRGEDDNSGKVVTVTGDSFLVPRSYVGYSDPENHVECWGTGQYKVEMDISESCRINENYYTYNDKGKKKWNKEWKKEWSLMKKRPKRGGSQSGFVDMIFPQFADRKWITTIIEPSITTLVKHEGQYVNAGATKLGAKLGATVTPASGQSGGSSQSGKQGQSGK